MSTELVGPNHSKNWTNPRPYINPTCNRSDRLVVKFKWWKIALQLFTNTTEDDGSMSLISKMLAFRSYVELPESTLRMI